MSDDTGDVSEEVTEEEDGELRVLTEEPSDYTVHPSSSVKGGVQLRGDFLLEFMVDSYDDPGASVYSISDDSFDFVRHEDYNNAVVQRKQTGVLMSQSHAFTMAKWVISELFGEGVDENEVEDVLLRAFSNELEDRGDDE